MKLETALAIYALLGIGWTGIWAFLGIFNNGFRISMSPFYALFFFGSLASGCYLIVQYLQTL